MLEEDYGTQLDENGRRYIRTVRSGSQRMAALIDDLLAFSRLNRQSLNRQTVDMTALARRVAAEILEGHPEPKPAVEDRGAATGCRATLHCCARYGPTYWQCRQIQLESRSTRSSVCAATEGSLVATRSGQRCWIRHEYVDKLFGVFQRLHNSEGVSPGLASDSPSSKGRCPPRGAVTTQGGTRQGGTFQFTLADGGLIMGEGDYERWRSCSSKTIRRTAKSPCERSSAPNFTNHVQWLKDGESPRVSLLGGSIRGPTPATAARDVLDIEMRRSMHRGPEAPQGG